MMIGHHCTRLSTLLLVSLRLVAASVESDKPVQFLIDTANNLLTQGNTQRALEYFDEAVQKDPSNYITIFKRGATYLSLGKLSQAATDFDNVLSLKPDFESALVQRSKLRARVGDWKSAKRDLSAAGRGEDDLRMIEEAEASEEMASAMEKSDDMEGCVAHASKTLSVAPALLSMRERRARCRLAIGDVAEVVADLSYVSQLAPGATEIHIRLASLLFYSLNDNERALTQLRKCLHFDPDCRPCIRLHKRIKSLKKDMEKSKALQEKRQFIAAGKILAGSGEEPGLIADVKHGLEETSALGHINASCRKGLLVELVEMACAMFSDSKQKQKSKVYCDEALELNPDSIPALISKSSRLITEEAFEDAITLLNKAKELDPQNSRIQELMNKAHTLLKRSKQKDYYKVLDVNPDATERDIKTAYRRMTKQYHPDKARSSGLTTEEAEKKMAAINEAYEVLSNEELRARFDRGDDPNSQEPPFQQGGFPFGQGFGGGFPSGQQFFFKQDGGGGGNPFGGGFPGGGEFKFHFG